MFRRLLALPLVMAGLSTASWNFYAAQLFGRVDPVSWERNHPASPPPPADPGPVHAALVSTRRIVPGTGLPREAEVQHANNNLDVVRHSDGRVYLVWRTAPDHFASAKVALNVVSSTDEQDWRFETRFALGQDVREPRLLSMGDKLHLFFARLGTNGLLFEPQGTSRTVRAADGTWSAPKAWGPRDLIAWRLRVVDGRALMIGYTGGASIYSFSGDPLRVHMFASMDGDVWKPAFGNSSAVLEGSGSETDFSFDDKGGLFALVRNEAGDAQGFGSKVCQAPADAPGRWTCTSDRRKFDSPVVFRHNDEVYAIGRRQVTPTGAYDLETGGPHLWRLARNQLAYITTAKRCSLWRFDRAQARMAFVLDLPSRGDTCFASVLDGASPDEIVVYNYSSDIDGPDVPWAAGQRRDTFIYRHVLRFGSNPALSAAVASPVKLR